MHSLVSMNDATRVHLGIEGQAAATRRATRAIGAALCCAVVVACALAAVANQGPSDLVQSSPMKSGSAPASVADFLSNSVEKQHGHAASAGVTEEKLKVLQTIAGSVKAQVDKLNSDTNARQSASHKATKVKLADATATRAANMVNEAQKRWQELHKTNTASAASSAASHASSGRYRDGDINSLAAQVPSHPRLQYPKPLNNSLLFRLALLRPSLPTQWTPSA